MRLAIAILSVLFLVPSVFSLESPCFDVAKVVGNGQMKVVLLNWTSSLEPDVVYSIYYNLSSIALYEGNQSYYYANIYAGNNSFGVAARTWNDSKVCEGVVIYELNVAPSSPVFDCPSITDVSLSNLICNISYDSIDPNGDSILYPLFLDGNLTLPDFRSQSVPVQGIQSGVHNISICAFDGELFACSVKSVDFQVIPVPYFVGINITKEAVPFYGDMAPAYARVDLQINSSIYFNLTGTIVRNSNSYLFNCSGAGRDRVCLALLTYLMEPGYYAVNFEANNGFRLANYAEQNAIEVYEVLSFSSSSPKIDLTQVFDDWAYSLEPIVFKNLGSVKIKKLELQSRPIVCAGASFTNITAGDGISRANDLRDKVLFGVSLDGGDRSEFDVFVYNPGRLNPANCQSIWDVEARYVK